LLGGVSWKPAIQPERRRSAAHHAAGIVCQRHRNEKTLATSGRDCGSAVHPKTIQIGGLMLVELDGPVDEVEALMRTSTENLP